MFTLTHKARSDIRLHELVLSATILPIGIVVQFVRHTLQIGETWLDMQHHHHPVGLENLAPRGGGNNGVNSNNANFNANNRANGTRIPVPSSSKLPTKSSTNNLRRVYLEDRTNSLCSVGAVAGVHPPTSTQSSLTHGNSHGRLSSLSSYSDSSASSSTESAPTMTSTLPLSGPSVSKPPVSKPIMSKLIASKPARGRSLASLVTQSSVPRISKSLDRQLKDGSENNARTASGSYIKQNESVASASTVNNTDEMQLYLKAEVRRLRTEAAEWELDKRKQDDLVSDLQEKLRTERDSFHAREESLRQLVSEREQTIFELRSELQDLQRRHQLEVDNRVKELQQLAEREIADMRTRHADDLREQTAKAENEISRKQRLADEERARLLEIHRKELESLRLRLESELAAQQSKSDAELERYRVRSQQELHEHRLNTEHQLALYKNSEAELQERFSQQSLHFEQLTSLHKERQAQIQKEFDLARRELEDYREKYESQKHETESLRSTISELTTSSVSLESATRAQEQRIAELQLQLANQQDKSADMRSQLQAALEERDVAKQKLLKEELIRRKLHNQIQELKGNIRVYCRVRPPLSPQEQVAQIGYPDLDTDGQQLALTSVRSDTPTGGPTTSIYPFSFDKVFPPSSSNSEIFDEISQLVQSALDGYNVCIFAYGQTGSGKTYTMSSDDGMIPSAMFQIFETAESLKERGWVYKFEGQFLEIYNENINDLLGAPGNLDKSKLEIRHDTKAQKTSVIGLTSVPLDSPDNVFAALKRASSNRSVAATKANERSSRSHSVFTVRIAGHNSITNHSCEGMLNLIDLAGSERLDQSQATGDRLKETQAINKSLSSLGDVIYALGNSKEGSHIPYRNSKLTYLLQYSLSGNSKTLMFVNISPLEDHVNETLSSLRFATKVNNTQIAKKTSNGK